MMQLPYSLGASDFYFWRIDQDEHARTWISGEGSYIYGGRWNSKGVRAVYASVDPATAILEVAVHKGFNILDTFPHTLTSARIIRPTDIHIVSHDDIPNPNWIRPCTPSHNQQKFGDQLLSAHKFILIPSSVSQHSWNIIFDPNKVIDKYDKVSQERFSLDTRLGDYAAP